MLFLRGGRSPGYWTSVEQPPELGLRALARVVWRPPNFRVGMHEGPQPQQEHGKYEGPRSQHGHGNLRGVNTPAGHA
eukprot:9043947-Pyramimonas_sp.AAC.1